MNGLNRGDDARPVALRARAALNWTPGGFLRQQILQFRLVLVGELVGSGDQRIAIAGFVFQNLRELLEQPQPRIVSPGRRWRRQNHAGPAERSRHSRRERADHGATTPTSDTACDAIERLAIHAFLHSSPHYDEYK